MYIQFVGDKVAYALSQGLKVIACVGETLEQRESGSTLAVVAAQTQSIAGSSSNIDRFLDSFGLFFLFKFFPSYLPHQIFLTDIFV